MKVSNLGFTTNNTMSGFYTKGRKYIKYGFTIYTYGTGETLYDSGPIFTNLGDAVVQAKAMQHKQEENQN